jgi:hypothetical protein
MGEAVGFLAVAFVGALAEAPFWVPDLLSDAFLLLAGREAGTVLTVEFANWTPVERVITVAIDGFAAASGSAETRTAGALETAPAFHSFAR